ncbi:P-loop NTPase fold protein [Idiomarina abyssalis]|uniref:P-loop NTPase fold protein n=1 Tax=Idiomarina abyssalis TaxID=86102 RepID=UPI003A942278
MSDQQEQATPFSFRVLNESVADEDLLRHQTHENIASTVEKIIKREKEGFTIGLEGQWGSGKSTIVNILKKKLTDNSEDTLFFIFDTWAHEGDSLRKGFLKSFIKEAEDNSKLVTSEDLNTGDSEKVSLFKELKETNQDSVTETISSSSPSVWGLLLSLSLILLPSSASLISNVDFSNVSRTISTELPVNWKLVAGIAALISSLSFLTVYIIKAISGKTSLLRSDVNQVTTENTFQNGERNSSDFEEIFSETVKKLLGKDKPYKKIIIVIDNIDRLEHAHVRLVWSTLQTFFQHRSESNTEESVLKNKLWFIVPYDRNGFMKALNPVSDKNRLQEVLDKNFQLVVEVPSQLTSSWIGYFEDAVEESLIGWPEESKEEFKKCYVAINSNLERSPTPREIRALLNRSGAIAMLWGEEVSSTAICIYAHSRRISDENEFRKKLLYGDIQFPSSLDISRNALISELAGLLFNVRKKDSSELLLTPEILNCLKEGDAETLKVLSKMHKGAFWVAWRHSEDKICEIFNYSSAYLCKATDAISGFSKPIAGNGINTIDNLKESWVERLRSDDITDSKEELPQSLKRLVNLAHQNEELLSELKKCGERLISVAYSDIATNPAKDTDDFTQAVFLVIEALETFSVYPRPSTLEHSKANTENWVKWKLVTKRLELENDYIQLPLKSLSQLHDILAPDGLQSPQGNYWLLHELYIKTYREKEWVEFAEFLVDWLQRSKQIEVNDVFQLLTMMFDKNPEDFKSSIKTTKTKEFWSRQSDSSDFYQALFAGLYADDQAWLTFQHKIPGFWSTLPDEPNIDIISSYFEEHKERLWHLALNKNLKAAKHIIVKSSNVDFCDDLFPALNLERVKNSFREDFSDLTKRIYENGHLKALFEAFSEKPNEKERDVLTLLELGDVTYEKEVCEALSQLPASSWQSLLSRNSRLLRCDFDKSDGFDRAFEELIERAITKPNIQLPRISNELLSKLVERTVSFEEVASRLTKLLFETQQNNLPDPYFQMLKGYFSNHINQVEQSNLDKKAELWIKNHNADKVDWLSSLDIELNLNPHTENLLNALGEPYKTLRQKLKSKVKN